MSFRGFFYALCLLSLMGLGGCNGCAGCAKRTTQAITQKTVETTKGAVSGVKEGLDEGRKGTESVDGAVVVFTREEAAKYVGIMVQSITKGPGANTVDVTIGFANSHNKPVRVAGLNLRDTLLLVDKDGFASHIAASHEPPESVTISPMAKEKFTFTFDGDVTKTAKVRVLGQDYPVPASVAVQR